MVAKELPPASPLREGVFDEHVEQEGMIRCVCVSDEVERRDAVLWYDWGSGKKGIREGYSEKGFR